MSDIDSDSNKHFSITVRNKQPSEKLLALINESIDTGIKFTNMIDQIWEQGAKEGFSKEEIADIIRPIARKKGLNKDKVYYLTHKPELQDKSKQQYLDLKSRNIPVSESESNSYSHNHRIAVKDWKIDDLGKYDRDFLIEIIHYLNGRTIPNLTEMISDESTRELIRRLIREPY